MRRLLALLVACGGGSSLPPAPPSVSAGPVTIDTTSMTLSVAGLSITSFVSVGTVASIDPTHYYDATADAGDGATFDTPAVKGVDGSGAIVLDDGATFTLAAGPIANSAELDVDASAVGGAVFLRVLLPKDPAEPLYGTGDAPDAPNVAGSVREMELRVSLDSESGTNETHEPVPLVLWPRHDLGALVADDRPGALDLGKAAPDRVAATFALPARGVYKIYIYTAASPLDLSRAYASLSAKPAVPPRWAFAPQLWRNEWASGDDLRADAAEQRTLHVPGSTLWIDNPWETAYNTFDVDTTRFPDPAQLLSDMHAQGYNVIFWSTPYLLQSGITAADFTTASQQGQFVTDNTGLTLVYPTGVGAAGLIDFSQPAATAFWQQRIAKMTSIGANGFKLDFGEDLVPDLGGDAVEMELHAGDNQQLHARFGGLYHEAYAGPDTFLITRAGAWGEQATNTAIWPGDLDSDFTLHGVDNGAGKINVGGLPTAISRGLSLSVSGYPFYGSDIGGFRDGPNSGAPTTEALLRWAEYAAFGTIMQLGGGGPSHDPWDTTLFDADAAGIYATYAQLHMQLHPYLYTLALAAGTDGTPVNRPARFVYDCACDDAMFLLGDDVLVAPVITEGATTRDVVLPPGTWVYAWTGEVMTGSATVPAPIDQIPYWYRAGSLVPMYARYADTLLPVTSGSATSYADPALGGEQRLIYTAGADATAALHDGAQASVTGGATLAFTPGSEYTVATFELALAAAPATVTSGGQALPEVADVTACAAPGCWSFAGGTLRVRMFGGTAVVAS